ncbi:MAG: DNA-binding domain-containing protein [Betaproteobacteria bacterium]
MKRLLATENRFQDYVISGTPAIDSEIEGRDAAFREQRLAIYRDAYRLRLAEVLGTDYGNLHSYLGDDAFNELAREYLAAHPSSFRNVRWFGGKLADFLAEIPRYAAHPELAELARFEWALGRAFDAPDEASVSFEQVASVPPEAWAGLRFRPHPALRTMELRTNAVAIWKLLNNEEDPCAAETLAAPVTWAVWRKEHSPFFRSLEDDEAWALAATVAGSSFGELCAGLCDWIPEDQAAPRAAGLLRGWVEEGWIAELRLGGD